MIIDQCGDKHSLFEFLPRLKELHLTNHVGLDCVPHVFRSLESCSLKSLRVLRLIDSPTSSSHVTALVLPELTALRSLTLTNFHCHGLCYSLCQMPYLEELSLSDVYMTGPPSIFSESLLIIPSLKIDFPSALAGMTDLRLLELKNGGEPAEILSFASPGNTLTMAFKHLTKLAELTLGNCYGIDDLGSALALMTDLRKLSCSYKIAPLACLESLTRVLPQLQKMESLRLLFGALGNPTATALASTFVHLSSLVSLRLYWKDEGGLVSVISSLSHLTGLHALNLSGIDFGDKAAILALAKSLKSLRGLTELHLERCRIKDAGLVLLAPSLVEPKSLMTLHMSRNTSVSKHTVGMFRFAMRHLQEDNVTWPGDSDSESEDEDGPQDEDEESEEEDFESEEDEFEEDSESEVDEFLFEYDIEHDNNI